MTGDKRIGPPMQVNKATVNMLRLVEPYVAWGYPNLKTVKELIYKRGYAKVGLQHTWEGSGEWEAQLIPFAAMARNRWLVSKVTPKSIFSQERLSCFSLEDFDVGGGFPLCPGLIL